MSKHKWFFKRGNARLSWETLPEWVQWVAVSVDGNVWGCEHQPGIYAGWLFDDSADTRRKIMAHVGENCPDWRDLLFERPRALSAKDCEVSIELNKLTLPTITAEEWAAIRMLLPGAEYVMRSRNYGYVNASNVEPVLYEWSSDWSVPAEGELIRVPVLDRRFDHVPWRESLVKYEAAS